MYLPDVACCDVSYAIIMIMHVKNLKYQPQIYQMQDTNMISKSDFKQRCTKIMNMVALKVFRGQFLSGERLTIVTVV